MSLINGTSSALKLEILVIDGGSSDDTHSIVEKLQTKHSFIRLLHNAKKIVPAAMNLGIKHATHEYLVWCGAHAIYEPGYIENSINVLREENCASSGGILTPIGKTEIGKAVALATISRFGIGSVPYRHATKRVAAKSVFGGCFTRTDVQKIGGFNEKWTRNQDVEFNYRLRTQVGNIVIDPEIRCYYFCRDSFTNLFNQYFQYGFWRFKTTIIHPGTYNLRLLAPVILVLGLMFSIIGIAFDSFITLIIPTLYLSACLLQAIRASIENQNAKLLILLPLIFITIHISWGLGFITSSALSLMDKIRSTIAPNKNGSK